MDTFSLPACFKLSENKTKEKRLQILLFFFSLLTVKAVKSLTNFVIGVFEVCLSVCQEELASVSGLRLGGWSPAAGTGKQQSPPSLQQLSARETKTLFAQCGNAKTKKSFRAPTPKEFPWGLEFCQLTHKHSQGKVKDISRQQPGASQRAQENTLTDTLSSHTSQIMNISAHVQEYLCSSYTQMTPYQQTHCYELLWTVGWPSVVCVWEQRSKLCVTSC